MWRDARHTPVCSSEGFCRKMGILIRRDIPWIEQEEMGMMYGYGHGMSFMMYFGVLYLIGVALFLYFVYDIGRSLRRIAALLAKKRPE
jgi:hypothetical protein